MRRGAKGAKDRAPPRLTRTVGAMAGGKGKLARKLVKAMHRFMLLLLVLLGACAVTGPSSTTTPTKIDPPTVLSDFTLPASTGGELSLSDLRGQPVLLYFGYTRCPDYCPITLGEFRRVRDELGPDSVRVHFVLISVDPANDTPDVLAAYLRGFGEGFIGLQGDDATLRRISKEYGLTYRHGGGHHGNSGVDHSTASYLIDQKRRLRVVYPYGTAASVYVNDIRALLNEQP